MATLVFTGPDGEATEHELSEELTVGRVEGNDIVLPENGVSRKHARFFVEGGKVYVEDVGSANGTYLDEERIEGSVALPPRVAVRIGLFEVRLKEAPKPAPKPARPAPAKPAAGASRAAPAKAAVSSATGGRGDAPPARRGPAPSDAGAQACLKGSSGPWSGQSFPLSKARLTVGRTAPADIVIDDASVSRRHAEISLEEGRYLLRDLGSANGTCLNGEAISEELLAAGDEIRFGNVELLFADGGDAKALADRKKRLMLLGGAGGLVLLVLIGLGLAGGHKGQATVAEEGEEAPAEDAERFLGLCKAYTDPDSPEFSWEQGAKACSKVLQLDPINAEARKLSKLATKEVRQGSLYQEARKKFELGHNQEAVEGYLQVEGDSYYFVRARADFRKCAEKLTKDYSQACRSELQAGNYSKALESCAHALDFYCHQTLEPELKERLALAEKYAGRKSSWVCPPSYGRFMRDMNATVQLDEQRKKLLEATYGDAEVVAALLKYVSSGDAKSASDTMKRLKDDPAKAGIRKLLVDLSTDLDVVSGKSTSGQALVLANKWDAAGADLRVALDADARIVPPGVVSKLGQEIRDQQSGMFKRKGDGFRATGRLPEAFREYAEGAKANPSDTVVRTALVELANKAQELMDKGGCADLELAAQITLPDTPAHKQAGEKAQRKGCR